ncbi:MAG: endonuclease III [Chloroflexi bacterium]|nr:endonuclease III [Chloroflexota bacterium]
MSDPNTVVKALIKAVYERLHEQYGVRRWRRRRDPVRQLVVTILSQNTNDVNALRAFDALQETYPDWMAVMTAPTHELAEVIRSGGLANQKAQRIQHALRRIYETRGEFDLDWLAELSLEEARAWLTSLDGVGAKTASIVLLFSLGLPAFPVDTHVGRVLRRVGVAPAKASPDQIMAIVEQAAPAEWFYSLHLNLIRHGRGVCRARIPRCEACALNDICQHYLAHTTHEP